ncbi:hypothetical protein M9H77_23938 [Catharanthus roseus]|uniref:Uncharacterized protein n=1 Tax=Catharanthus roseus TaxID=4058 RepID=A0ACC0AUQ7_CATRO|nr:hypothetical protein M9H77_23938 [Catharanthus roseus]
MMQKLRRKWGKSRRYRDDDHNFSLPTRDDFRPLDFHEQEELVRTFERSQAQQSLVWRIVFSGMLIGYILFLSYSIYQQANFPWHMRYHAYFMYELNSWNVVAADCVAVLVCLITIFGLLHNSKHHKECLWYSCFLGLLLAFFWLYHMMRLSKFRWDLIWLSVGPLSGAGICLYVDRLLDESSEEVRKLRGYMYSYKAG